MQVRPQGDDFSTTLPGADLEGLYAIEAGGEAVKLAMRIFWYLDVFPGRVRDGELGAGAGVAESDSASGQGREGDGPVPTALPYRRVFTE